MHPPILQPLLKLIPSILQPLTRRLNIIHTDTYMSKALAMVLIPITTLIVGIVLRTVVVRKLDDAFAVGPVIRVGDGFGTVVGHEVEVKFVVGKLEFVDLLHAEEFVEFDRGFGVFDPEHGVVEPGHIHQFNARSQQRIVYTDLYLLVSVILATVAYCLVAVLVSCAVISVVRCKAESMDQAVVVVRFNGTLGHFVQDMTFVTLMRGNFRPLHRCYARLIVTTTDLPSDEYSKYEPTLENGIEKSDLFTVAIKVLHMDGRGSVDQARTTDSLSFAGVFSCI